MPVAVSFSNPFLVPHRVSSNRRIRSRKIYFLQISGKYVTLCAFSKILLEAEPYQSVTNGLGSTRMFFGKDADSPRSADDRRNMRRFDMRLPASVKVVGDALGELMTETQNVSARGVFFYLDRPLPQGARIEVTMTFPPHVTLTEAVRIRFTARVVRIEDSLPVSRVGIAALIEEYEFLRADPERDFLASVPNDWSGSN
jgi:hypothetical protein